MRDLGPFARWPSAAAALLVLAVLASACAALQSNRTISPSPATGLPQPSPQPITRTGAGAQIGWVSVIGPGGDLELAAYDRSGRLVGKLPAPLGAWRSADGTRILVPGTDAVQVVSAADGHLLVRYKLPVEGLVQQALSPDGRFQAALMSVAGQLRLQLVDLATGQALSGVPVPHDTNALTPGSSQPTFYSSLTFGPDSKHVYVLSDYGSPASLGVYAVGTGGVQTVTTARLADLRCGGGIAMKVVNDSRTLAAFCHFNGGVWLIDLNHPGTVTALHPRQSNPFWVSPIFTPDGRLLYLVEPGAVQLVDLASGKVLGPVAPPKSTGDPGPFAALTGLFVTTAEAGFIASTVPVSPDGLKVYLGGSDGVMVLRVPDLKPLAKLAPGVSIGEIWVSGDGSTLYATTEDGKRLLVMAADGSQRKAVDLPGSAGGFIASEHG